MPHCTTAYLISRLRCNWNIYILSWTPRNSQHPFGWTNTKHTLPAFSAAWPTSACIIPVIFVSPNPVPPHPNGEDDELESVPSSVRFGAGVCWCSDAREGGRWGWHRWGWSTCEKAVGEGEHRVQVCPIQTRRIRDGSSTASSRAIIVVVVAVIQVLTFYRYSTKNTPLFTVEELVNADWATEDIAFEIWNR